MREPETVEMRRYKRHSVPKAYKVYIGDSDRKIGNLVNISVEGLMLLGEHDIAEGNVYQVRIDSNDDTLTLGIECLWVNSADTENKMWSGFRIIDINSADAVTLERMICELNGG